MHRSLLAFLLIAITAVVAPAQTSIFDDKPAATESKKIPVPTAAALAQAKKLVLDIFKADLSATKTNPEKLALAEKLMKTAEEDRLLRARLVDC